MTTSARLYVLNGGGHLTLEWTPGDPGEEARAREEVRRLAEAGYDFFLTETEPADAVAAGRGRLIVRRLEDPVFEIAEMAAPAIMPSPDVANQLYGDARADRDLQDDPPASDSAPAPPPNGRRRARAPQQPGVEAVAVRRQRGG